MSASPTRVYHYLSHPDTLADLDRDIPYWQPEELPPRVGTLNRFKWKVFGMPTFFELVSRFAEVDPPHRFVIEGVRPRMMKNWRWTMELIERPDGGTRGISAFELSSSRWALPLERIGLSFFRYRARRSITTSLDRLGGLNH